MSDGTKVLFLPDPPFSCATCQLRIVPLQCKRCRVRCLACCPSANPLYGCEKQ
jgi:hypothetical protein